MRPRMIIETDECCQAIFKKEHMTKPMTSTIYPDESFTLIYQFVNDQFDVNLQFFTSISQEISTLLTKFYTFPVILQNKTMFFFLSLSQLWCASSVTACSVKFG